jgi:hypothetical protein
MIECIGISTIYWPPARRARASEAYASERRLGLKSGKILQKMLNQPSLMMLTSHIFSVLAQQIPH